MAESRRAIDTGEAPDPIDKRAVHVALAILLGLVPLALLVAWGMHAWFLQQRPLLRPLEQVPPQPRLLAAPPGEVETLREESRRRLQGYGWVDRERGLVYVPIERAMELAAEQLEWNDAPGGPP